MTSPALGSPYSDAVLADGPRGYWRLGDSASPAVDASGFGSAGAYGGGVLLGVPGALPGDPDTAAHLDGVNDLVNMGDPASGALDFGTGDFSVELWVRTPLNGERSLVAKRGSAAGSWLLTVTDDSGHAGQIRAGVSDGVVGQQVYSTRAIDDGAWHHVVVVADRDTALRFYVDGAAAGTAPASPPGSVSNTGPFQLGKISGYGHLSGDLDEVAVYAKALTPERISAHYGAAAPDLPATVTIVSGPPNPTAATDATFSFFPSEPASLECSLDGGPFAACVSPHGYSGLAEGLHTARVRAIDLGGQIGPATSYAWRVDLTPPAAPVVSHAPPPLSNDPDDTISFSAESGATFLCRLNLDAFAPCASPFHYTALADGPHAFEVMAVDAAGNSGPTAAVAWLLDTVPPAGPSLTGSPPNPSASGAAEFTFTRSDGVGFLCRFNGSPFVPCASPQTFTGLPDGHHVFDVRTVDEAGNGSEPVRFTWTIERGPPEPTIDSGPAGLTTGTGAQFAFSDTAAEVTYQCRLDTAAFEPCASPRSYAGLTDGTHEFEVRAFFASGWDSPPVSYDWSVDTAAPVAPTVTSRPEEATSSSAATIAFSDGSGPPPPLGAALPAPLPEATGPTYYVATTGSDANPGSETLPWRTVQRALDRLHPGERALVRGGVYEQNLRVNDAGTAEAPMAIEAYPGERPVLRPGVVSPSFPIRVTSDGGYVRVRGFVIEGATGSTSAGVYVSSPAHHVELSNNEIRGGEGHGILLDGDTASVHILGNHIHHNGSPIGGAQKHGIYFQGSDQVAADNVIHDHAFGFGIQVYDENHRSLVVNNTIVRNGKSGVVLGGAVGVDGIRVIGNILAFNSHHGIGHDAIHPTGSQAHDNVIFGNGHGAFDPAGTGIDFSGGNVLADPRFASLTARDFRLLSDSPALGAADPAYTRAAGSRALGGAPDSGALESVVRFECSLDGAAYQACASPSEHSELAEGTHTFLVRSLDDAGNVGAPAEVTWAVDTIAPTTLITGPADPDNDPAPALSFAASEEGASFECALDGADFAACVSPQTYGNLVDGAHVFAARATDGAGNAGPASTHSWTLDTVAPLAPVVDSGPPALTASTSAELMFSSGAAGASFHCSLDGAAATACASPATYAGLGEGGHVFEVTARDAAGNESGAGRHQWTVDGTPPPAPTLTAQPQNVTSSTSAILEFNSAEAEVTFRCRLDDQGAGACSSPQAYGGLVEGAHTFEVEAVDLAGNASIAAVATWVIDVTPPSAPTIDSGPAQLTASRAAELAFSSAETGVSFRCGVDGTPATPCSSPAAYGGLADGGHSFEVKAVDAAGNEGPATTTTWTVDGTAPAAALILAGPPALTRSREAELTFSSVEPGLSFRCSLDGGPPAACASPFSRSDLADGPHAFEVVARDAAGNESAAASRGWTVDGTAPVAPEITSVPPVVGGSSSATFAFSHPEPGVRFVCVLDLGAPAECVSPVNYAGLLPGAHTFSVRALDPAGNESVATAYAWAVVQADPRYEAAVLADAPNGYWRLGELGVPTAIDGSGFGSLGTYLGGVGLGVSGALLRESDTAAHFDGSNDLVAMGDPPSGVLDFGTGDFSLELWARTTANGERTLIAKRASSGPAWLVTVTDDPGQAGHLRVLVTAGSVTRQVYSVVRVDDGAWHHVVIVFDRDAGVGFYVDGLAAGFSAGALTATVSNAASFQLGKTSGYAYFTGDLDEVAVYPTLLGEPRIRAHHDAGRG